MPTHAMKLHEWGTQGIGLSSCMGHPPKIVRMASRPGDNVKLSIGDLDDRQAMLYDFRARLSFMKRDLAELLAGLPRGPVPDEGGSSGQ
jgi:hypothetical protein